MFSQKRKLDVWREIPQDFTYKSLTLEDRYRYRPLCLFFKKSRFFGKRYFVHICKVYFVKLLINLQSIFLLFSLLSIFNRVSNKKKMIYLSARARPRCSFVMPTMPALAPTISIPKSGTWPVIPNTEHKEDEWLIDCTRERKVLKIKNSE